MSRAEQEFFVCTAAVNRALARSSTRHNGQPCPATTVAVATTAPVARTAPVATTASVHDGQTVLAYCDRGCFDDAIDVLADTLRRIRRTRRDEVASVAAYANRAAAAALGDLHRSRRKRLGLPQRPERVTDADWAVRVLPNRADRSLLAHMLTWLGCDAPALDGHGWPVEAWADRYDCSAEQMAASVARVVEALRTADPRRYLRYLAEPFAAKPHDVRLFGTVDDMPVGMTTGLMTGVLTGTAHASAG